MVMVSSPDMCQVLKEQVVLSPAPWSFFSVRETQEVSVAAIPFDKSFVYISQTPLLILNHYPRSCFKCNNIYNSF